MKSMLEEYEPQVKKYTLATMVIVLLGVTGWFDLGNTSCSSTNCSSVSNSLNGLLLGAFFGGILLVYLKRRTRKSKINTNFKIKM